ncbi:nucleotidyltransferase family protein [Fontisphaera persica]|uniref:nucleotidyltransferase family protein n=1 Tax=Fontisphaera persica TaxID=2974023 RepID=UPI0024BF604F|nr:nucleotidyltransferase family protein [Fontisphaera persica]WCJ60405.1 nucleotidyltransferase family protein [Fontisphaera persica]
MTSAIILAAGQSRRMGLPKQLLPVDGVPLLTKVAAAFPPELVKHLLIVIRPDSKGLRHLVALPHVQWVENPAAEGDMLSSVRCGLRALPKGTETVIVTPADLPGLTASLTCAMLEAWRNCGKSILVPVFQRRRGHPLVFSADYLTEILSQYDSVGLRGLLQAHPHEVFEWEAPSASVLDDWDTPEDWQRWQQRW